MTTSPPPFLDDAFAGAARLAIFGKHPAAADHLEELGLSTASLVAFKQGFYIDGIGGSLAKQTWHKELPAGDAVPYDHELLCAGRAGWLAARFTHSSDASGRRQYPLVVAVHGGDTAALHHTAAILDELDAQSDGAAGLKDANALRQAQIQGQAEWESRVTKWSAEPVVNRQVKEAWLRSEGLGPDLLGLQRICHALLPQGAGAGRARVPLVGVEPGLSRVLWLSFVRELLGWQVPVLTIITRHGDAFGDLVLGPPGARALTALFAGIGAQPLTSAVPFNLAGDLAPGVDAVVDAWLRQPALFSEPDTTEDSSDGLLQRICSGFRSWLKS